MMQFLSHFLGLKEAKKKRKHSAYDFFTSMPEEKRNKMVRKAIANSNKEQQKILREYQEKAR